MITPIFAGILGIIYFALSINVIKTRRKAGIAIGTKDNEEFLRPVRAHANFAEYVPIALVLILLAEMQGVDKVYICLLGAMLVVGRLLHLYGILKAELTGINKQSIRYRVSGMMLTFFAILISSMICLTLPLFSN